MRRLIVLLPFVLLLFSLKAYAIGVSSPYLENNTLQLIKGQSTIYAINLQNPENADINVKISYSSDIAKIIDYKEMYTLPAGKLDTPILFNITASEETKINKIYVVSYSVKPLPIAAGGTLPMTMSIAKQFNVKIIKDPNRANMRVLWYYAAFIAILVIIIFILTRLKKKPD